MKKILFISLMVVSSFAYSIERQKPVICHQLSEILNNIKTNYGEKLDFIIENQMYRDFVTKIAVYRNTQTGSWTMIEYGENFGGEGCIIGSGKDTTS